MGIYNQHFVDILPMDKTPVEHLRDQFNDQDYQSIRNRLGRYGLQVRASTTEQAERRACFHPSPDA
jgi:ATP-binding cassette subfamily F protein 1